MTVIHKAGPMWWFNLRASNTEPLLRLNVEAADQPTMQRVRDEVLSIVRAVKGTTVTKSADVPASPEPSGPSDSPAPRLEPWLREILRCPQCRSTLSDGSGPAGPELQCTNPECRRAYRIDDGIPVLLVDESRQLAN
jgi:uncharacterized protein YbaR (Trm112 family)